MYKIDTSYLLSGGPIVSSPAMRTASMRIKGEGMGQIMTPDAVASFMIALVTTARNSPVLEPGCGQGVFLEALKANGFSRVKGIDLDPRMAEACKAMGHDATLANFLTWQAPAQGYGAIIGNPPYVRRKDMRPETRSDLEAMGRDQLNGLADLLYAFIFRSVELLAPAGEVVFITPFYWFQSKHAGPLRHWMLEQGHFSHILDLGENNVFSDANVHTAIWRFVKGRPGNTTRIIRVPSQRLPLNDVLQILKRRMEKDSRPSEVLDFELRLPCSRDEIRLEPLEIAALLDGISSACVADFEVEIRAKGRKAQRISIQQIQPKNGPNGGSESGLRLGDQPYEWRHRTFEGSSGRRTVVLQDLFDNGPGMVSGLDAAFKVSAQEADRFSSLEKQLLIQVVKGPDIGPGQITSFTPYIRADHLTEEELETIFPRVRNHLFSFRERLDRRFDYGVKWFQWSFPRNERLFSENPGLKVFTPSKDRSQRPRFGYTEAPLFGTQDTTVLIPRAHTLSSREGPYFFIAYLNSFVVDLWTQWRGIHRGAVRQYSHESLAWIPMPRIDWNSPQQVQLYQKLMAGLPDSGPWNEEILTKIDQIFAELFALDLSTLSPVDFPLTSQVLTQTAYSFG